MAHRTVSVSSEEGGAVTLTEEELIRFGLYCLEESKTLRELCEQMKKINIADAVIEHKLKDARAFEIVARILLSTEKQTIKDDAP
jgi:hypothetical protein